MKVVALKGFPYAADGVTVVEVVAGDAPDILDALVPGLVKEGYRRNAPTSPRKRPQCAGRPGLVRLGLLHGARLDAGVLAPRAAARESRLRAPAGNSEVYVVTLRATAL